MRKPISFFSLIVFTLLFVGCNNEITVTLKQNGTLTPYVLDKDGKGIEGASFTVSYNSYGEYNLVEETTDVSGTIDPIKLIERNYYCAASVQKEKFTYQDAKLIQVISDENLRVELRPFDNIGSLSISVINQAEDYNEAGNITDLNVAITQRYYNGLDNYIENACAIKKVSSTGKVIFENIPVGDYVFIVYNDSKNWVNRGADTSVKKNETKEYTLGFYYWANN